MGALGGVLSMTAPVPDCVVPLTCARSPCREVAQCAPLNLIDGSNSGFAC